MSYTTLVSGTTITAAWANASVRDQVVTPFASAAARTSAVSTPIEGMVSWLNDVNRLDVYDGATYQPYLCPIGWAQRTTSSTSTTTEIGVLRIDSLALQANRAYEIWTSPLYLLSSVTGDVITARLRGSTAGSATTSSGVITSVQQKTDSIQPPAVNMMFLYQTSSAVTLSVLLTVGRASGSGNVSTFGADTEIYIRDAGPSLTDTGVDI